MSLTIRDIVDRLPEIAATTAAALTCIELAVSLRHGIISPNVPAKARRRNWVLVIGTVVTTFTFFGLILVYWEPKDLWTVWREKVSESFHTCSTKNKDKLTEEYKQSELNNDCLTLSLLANDFPDRRIRIQDITSLSKEAAPDNLEEYLRYQTAGTELMKDAEISATLSKELGLNTNLFLGSGYTVPLNGRRSDGAAINTGIREFLVKNFCVGENEDCEPTRPHLRTAWGWKLDPAEMDSKGDVLTIGQILNSRAPNLNQDKKSVEDWPAYHDKINRGMAARGTFKDRVLIRLSQFPARYYKGTFAATDRKYAFFSDARDVWGMSYKDAVEASGRLPDPDPNKSSAVFIWVAFAEPVTTVSGLASWDYVFQILRTPAASIRERGIRLTGQ